MHILIFIIVSKKKIVQSACKLLNFMWALIQLQNQFFQKQSMIFLIISYWYCFTFNFEQVKTDKICVT